VLARVTRQQEDKYGWQSGQKHRKKGPSEQHADTHIYIYIYIYTYTSLYVYRILTEVLARAARQQDDEHRRESENTEASIKERIWTSISIYIYSHLCMCIKGLPKSRARACGRSEEE